jgi:hypothetical protein
MPAIATPGPLKGVDLNTQLSPGRASSKLGPDEKQKLAEKENRDSARKHRNHEAGITPEDLENAGITDKRLPPGADLTEIIKKSA